jgi:hypothetical protein
MEQLNSIVENVWLRSRLAENLTKLHAFTSHMPMNSVEETIQSSYDTAAVRKTFFPPTNPRFSCLGNAETNSATIT